MAKRVDLQGLPEKEVDYVLRLVDFLRKKAKATQTKEQKDVAFAHWPLGVKGKLRRKEIYDYL